MKYIYRFCLMALPALSGLFTACTPGSNDEEELGPLPTAEFEVTALSAVNRFLLTSKDDGAMLYQWDLGDGAGFQDGTKIDTAYYPEKGNYTIRLRVLTAGGLATTQHEVEIANDDPNGCFGNKELLTDCSSKIWVLQQPDGGALWIGDTGGAQWWSNTAGDVNDAARVCQFDDEYTFTKAGDFIFENFGDMRVDDEASAPWPTDIGLDIGCHPMSAIPEKYQAWGSGNHKFKVTANSLQVIGTGAFLGLYKVGENGTTAVPEEKITYEIMELTAEKLVVRKMYGWGQWRFTFVPKGEE